MENEKVFVRYLFELPMSIRGVTTPNEDGTFSVYINGNLSQQQQQRALEHELRHIYADHLYDCQPVRVNEQEAESGAAVQTALPSAPLPEDAPKQRQEISPKPGRRAIGRSSGQASYRPLHVSAKRKHASKSSLTKKQAEALARELLEEKKDMGLQKLLALEESWLYHIT